MMKPKKMPGVVSQRGFESECAVCAVRRKLLIRIQNNISLGDDALAIKEDTCFCRSRVSVLGKEQNVLSRLGDRNKTNAVTRWAARTHALSVGDLELQVDVRNVGPCLETSPDRAEHIAV